MAGFSGLTFAVVPVVSGGELNVSGVTVGSTLIAGIVDPDILGVVFNPVAEGNPVTVTSGSTTGDTAATWLPVVKSISAAQVTDDYWTPATGAAGSTKTGMVTLELTPAASNTIEASSVMTYKLSPDALLITATGSF